MNEPGKPRILKTLISVVIFIMMIGYNYAADVEIGPDNELIVDGEKFFPLFAWDEPNNYLQQHKDLGLNTIMGYDGSDGDVVNWLDRGEELGLMMIPSHSYLRDDIANHSTLLSYYVAHEKETDNSDKTGPKEEANVIAARETDYKSRYPELPSLIIMTSRFWDYYRSGVKWMEGNYSKFGEFANAADIVSYDHYPMTGWNNAYNKVWEHGPMTDYMYNHYLDRQSPVWPIVEASDQDLPWTYQHMRGPLDFEMRAEVWLGIVHGAKGIGYFTIRLSPFRYYYLSEEIEDEMKRTNRQITELKDVILSPDVDSVQIETQTTNNLTMHTMAKIYEDKLWIFAVEGDPTYSETRGSGTSTFNISGVEITGIIEVYDEDRTITATDESFSGDFEQLGVHIYSVSTGCPTEEDINQYVGSWKQGDLGMKELLDIIAGWIACEN
jgi:hypothetical protein